MDQNWETYQAWIAHFDILGFKSALENDSSAIALKVMQKSITHIIQELQNGTDNFEGIEYLFYADTFIIYSKSNQISDYPGLMSISKNFISKCIHKKIPIRGAIAFGELIFGHNQRIIMGKAFLESYVYGEDQNWLGLILTPSATDILIQNELFPNRHFFINSDIPMRKHPDKKVFAYYFSNGVTSFNCTLLPPLKEMMHFAPENEKQKYQNTIEFIEKHYPVR